MALGVMTVLGTKVLLNLIFGYVGGLAFSKRYSNFFFLPKESLPLLPFSKEERSVVMVYFLSKLQASSRYSLVEALNLARRLLELNVLSECAGD